MKKSKMNADMDRNTDPRCGGGGGRGEGRRGGRSRRGERRGVYGSKHALQVRIIIYISSREIKDLSSALPKGYLYL